MKGISATVCLHLPIYLIRILNNAVTFVLSSSDVIDNEAF